MLLLLNAVEILVATKKQLVYFFFPEKEGTVVAIETT